MPMVHECAQEGCNVLTMRQFCVEHEALQDAEELPEVLTAAAAQAARGGEEAL